MSDDIDFDDYPVGDYDRDKILSELADEHRELKQKLQEFVERMRKNADSRDVGETQDMLAALEQHWAGELEQLIDDE